MVGTYPADIANGLSNIRLYCNNVRSKTTPLLVSIPTTKNRMLILCSQLLDRIEYELKGENDDPLSFISYMHLLIGSS